MSGMHFSGQTQPMCSVHLRHLHRSRTDLHPPTPLKNEQMKLEMSKGTFLSHSEVFPASAAIIPVRPMPPTKQKDRVKHFQFP